MLYKPNASGIDSPTNSISATITTALYPLNSTYLVDSVSALEDPPRLPRLAATSTNPAILPATVLPPPPPWHEPSVVPSHASIPEESQNRPYQPACGRTLEVGSNILQKSDIPFVPDFVPSHALAATLPRGQGGQAPWLYTATFASRKCLTRKLLTGHGSGGGSQSQAHGHPRTKSACTMGAGRRGAGVCRPRKHGEKLADLGWGSGVYGIITARPFPQTL